MSNNKTSRTITANVEINEIAVSISTANVTANGTMTIKVKFENPLKNGILEDVDNRFNITEDFWLLSNDGIQTFYHLGNFQHYGLNPNGTFKTDQLYRVSNNDPITIQRPLTVHVASGFKWGYILFNGDTAGNWVGWMTTDYDIPSGTKFVVQIARTTEDQTEIADVETFLKAVTFDTGLKSKMNGSDQLSTRVSVVENLFRYDTFFSHLGVEQTTNIVIPCQSIADVERTRRLGFKVLELNVLKSSDGEYFCLHGSSGKFGAQFVGADSSDVSDIAVSSKTSTWIKDNVRFVSKYAKYRTAPNTLEEMLYACKEQHIVPLVQFVGMDEVALINKIMGNSNYVLNLYSADRNGKTDAVCASWTAIPSISDAVAKCKASGKTYMLGVNHSNSAFSGFSDDDWKDYISGIHEAGYWVIGAYMTPQQVVKFTRFGWDAIASTAQINEIETGNILNLFADIDYTGFSSNGTVSDGILTLANGQVVTTQTNPDSVFLGGGSLHITFSGTISVNMGKISALFTSDGTHDTWISTYFEEQAPKFVITANGNATITQLSYKASRM